MEGEADREKNAKAANPEIARVEGLFDEDRDEQANRETPVGSAPASAEAGETFDLADGPSDESGADPQPVPPVIPTRERPASQPRESSRRAEARPVDAEAAVEEVWTRGGEWGLDLFKLGAWSFGVVTLLYFLVGWELYLLAVLVLLAGGAGAVLLSYPILITLERPVRITPEQALKDFYDALSHHLPHYRRMWLLLARTGRLCSSYGSFEGFKAYWKEKLQTIKGSQAGTWTPLVFQIENFEGEKSAGQSRVEVKFTLKVYIRGKRESGPIASMAGVVSLVRGPDKMWYLESGTLPHARPDSGRRG